MTHETSKQIDATMADFYSGIISEKEGRRCMATMVELGEITIDEFKAAFALDYKTR